VSERDLNFAGAGVHEVAALVGGVFVAGCFDSPDAAAPAIADLGGSYSACWSSLNPLATLPEGRILNPSHLTRGAGRTKEHIAKRVSLLLDFDPPRPKNTMSTDGEREAASGQAQECREWLRSMGWPLLPLTDSGSGFHGYGHERREHPIG
jgi:hypothetical protein